MCRLLQHAASTATHRRGPSSLSPALRLQASEASGQQRERPRARSAAWAPRWGMAGAESTRTELLAVCAVQRLPRRPLCRVPRRRRLSPSARRARRCPHTGELRYAEPSEQSLLLRKRHVGGPVYLPVIFCPLSSILNVQRAGGPSNCETDSALKTLPLSWPTKLISRLW